MAPRKVSTAGGRRLVGKATAAAKATNRQGDQNHPSNSNTQQTEAHQNIPLTVQQSLLSIFPRAFPDRLSPTAIAESLQPLLQEVKGHLYKRNFEEAFGRVDYLEAYAVRWSASRSLAYLHIFHSVVQFLLQQSGSKEKDGEYDEFTSSQANSPLTTRITCLGGGAGAELCGFAGLYSAKQIKSSETTAPTSSSQVSMSLVDVAHWESVCSPLYACLTSAPPISHYASAAVKAANAPLVSPESFHAMFHRINVLAPDEKRSIFNNILKESSIITIMFTLNELYSTSLADTQKLLLNITSLAQCGTLLLVVDSPGSYSTVRLNDREKKYPMNWLLDHTLLTLAPTAHIDSSVNADTISKTDSILNDDDETGRGKNKRGEDYKAMWEKVVSEESIWFRMPETLKYPIDLENMRYQIHLYRRI